MLGVLQEGVYYYQIGINILRYSTILDILISPIATLTDFPLLFLFLIVLFIPLYLLPSFLSNRSDKNWVQALAAQKNKVERSKEDIGNYFRNLSVIFYAFLLLSFFLGFGLGAGAGLAERMTNDNIVYNHKLTFMSGESESIYLINTNTMYHFYLVKGNKAIKISPLSAIKNIEFTNNKRIK